MTYAVLALAAACLIVSTLGGLFGTDYFLLDKTVAGAEPWRYVSSLFVHASLGHLLANLFALLLFGALLEKRIGTKRLLLLYFTAGNIVNIFVPYERSLGASGAIFALIGALVIISPRLVVPAFGVPMPLFLAGSLYAIQDVVGTFAPDEVGHYAHLGGLALGILCGVFWRRKLAQREQRTKSDPLFEKAIDMHMDLLAKRK